jgi:hypothetical protein
MSISGCAIFMPICQKKEKTVATEFWLKNAVLNTHLFANPESVGWPR